MLLRPERRNLVCAYGFVLVRLHNRRPVGLLTIIDEFTRRFLAIRAQRGIRSADVIETLAGPIKVRGVPERIRPDNGPKLSARAVREWLQGVDARSRHIQAGSSWDNGYVERFNVKLREELLNRGVLYTLLEVRALTEQYRQTHTRIRPHSILKYRPPAPETVLPADVVRASVELTQKVVQLLGDLVARSEYHANHSVDSQGNSHD